MFKRCLLALLLPTSLVPGICAQQRPAWTVNVQRHRDALVSQNGRGTDAVLQAQLLGMRDADQRARGIANGQAAVELQVAANLADVDAQLTAQLKDVVAKHGWPTIAMVGIEASNAAMLVLTHSRDAAWQQSMLTQLESLADAGKIDGGPLAITIDRELVNEGKLQRYGTQFKYVDGAMSMYAVEDREGLDALRAKVGLPPLGAYKAQLEAMYHLKATDKVVMATAPVAAAK